MDQATKTNLQKFYASSSYDELVKYKAEIGNLLLHTKVKDLANIKLNIELINTELKIKAPNV